VSGRLLIAGGGGQLGRALAQRAPAAGWSVTAAGRARLDLTDAESVAAAVRACAPDVAINAAAYTDVDGAEGAEAAAFAVNRDGPARLAAACARHGAALIHVSTDYVFPGTARAEPWRPEEPCAPVNLYGRSKLAGEAAVRASGARAAIVRTAWLFSASGRNFVRSMLRLGRERDRLTVVDDQLGAPTPADCLADALLAAAATLAARPASGPCHGTGTFHYTGTPPVTWYAFAQAIFAELAGAWPRLPAVAPIASADFPTAAARPAYSVLDTTSFAETFGVGPCDWRPGLRRVLAELGEIAPGGA
jgi:dTDP-4-dehydrorhamnose reductase